MITLPAPYDAMSSQERGYWRDQALAFVLRTLPAPAETGVVTAGVARVLGTVETAKLAQELVRLAPEHSQATHDGKRFTRFKRECVGWRWHPGVPGGSLVPLGRPVTATEIETAAEVADGCAPLCWLCGVKPGDMPNDGLCEPCRAGLPADDDENVI